MGGQDTYGVENEIDRASHIEVDKVHFGFLIDHIACPDHHIDLVACYLYTKNILTLVPSEKSEFSFVSLYQVGCHSHFSTCDIDTVFFTDAAEGQVADRCQRCQIRLASEINLQTIPSR